MQTAIIKIKGMTCMGCVNSIKTVLKNLPGIAQLEVTLDPAQAVVQFDPSSTNPDQLKAAIVDAGFDVIE
ncbi:MAG: heavy-metal-associated domain-containing protein [Proteobacteria bacterium]|nr:heavy-metal-associated domain-containing protein [Pseudomonadota bacterium]